MSELDILVAMATDFSNLRLFLEKVPPFAKNVLPNYFKSKSKKRTSLKLNLMQFYTL